MRWLNRLKTFLFCFACVTTCVVFVTAVYISIFWKQASLGVEILWQILFVSFLCSLVILVYPDREVSMKTAVVITALHYIEVNLVVMGCGLWFEWFYADNLPMIFAMLFVIALVFVLITAVMWARDRRVAANINERLKKYQDD